VKHQAQSAAPPGKKKKKRKEKKKRESEKEGGTGERQKDTQVKSSVPRKLS
jgi:hypothetical protein